MNNPYQAIIEAPFGKLGICVSEGLLTRLEFLPRGTPLVEPANDLTRSICQVITTYLSNPETPLGIPVLAQGTAFQRRVWQALQMIPVGATLSYSELAQQLGSGARAVANACGANPVALVIPCHRVVAKHGIGGFMRGRASDSLSIKQWLLQHERRHPASA